MIYQHAIGRFTTPDPLMDMFPQHTSYHYAYNSPLIWKDPSGLFGEKEKGDRILSIETILRSCGAVGDFIGRLFGLSIEPWAIDSGWLNDTDTRKDEKTTGGAGNSGANRTGAAVSGTARYAGGYGEDNRHSGPTTFSNDPGSNSKGSGDGSYGGGRVSNSSELPIKSFENVVVNWNSLSVNQQVAVRDALQIIYNDGCGQEVIDDLIKTGHTVSIDFSFTARQLSECWNDGAACTQINAPILGLASNEWNSDIIKINGSKGCSTAISKIGTIYLAHELINGSIVGGNVFEYLEYGFLRIFNSIEREQKELFMVFAHELKHRFDSYNHHGPLDAEESANRFMINVYNRYYYKKRKYIE